MPYEFMNQIFCREYRLHCRIAGNAGGTFYKIELANTVIAAFTSALIPSFAAVTIS